MSTRRALSLLAALVLLSPLVAAASPGCAPGAMSEHCPMMAVLAAERPSCHGTAMQADDCCPEMASAEPADAAPVIGVTVLEAAVEAPPALLATDVQRTGAAPCRARATPLYRLFRALLI